MENRKLEIQNNVDSLLFDPNAYFNEETPLGQLSPYVYSPKKGIVYSNQPENSQQLAGNNGLEWSNQINLMV
jgi:hypothetical protein